MLWVKHTHAHQVDVPDEEKLIYLSGPHIGAFLNRYISLVAFGVHKWCTHNIFPWLIMVWTKIGTNLLLETNCCTSIVFVTENTKPNRTNTLRKSTQISIFNQFYRPTIFVVLTSLLLDRDTVKPSKLASLINPS